MCDVIRKIIPKDRPCLILVDELLNYVSRNRKSGLSAQLYNFVHSLSEEACARGGNDHILRVEWGPGHPKVHPNPSSWGTGFLTAIALQYLDQGHRVFFAVACIDGFLEEAGDEIGDFRIDVSVNTLLLDTL